ncbi:MAG: nicotinamide-nucleotide amidohydrolase family protein [Thermoleophilia bacterium]|nr:nicotinamide-nucleotide amidohydrolase family protein [Thermoleophilia bacterium]
MTPRAAVVLTGTELVRGQRVDRNGPFLARELVALGVDPARLVIVGDGPADLEPAFRQALAADVAVFSGGLGPTHDDRTVELLAHVTGRRLHVDPTLAAEIEAVSRRISARFGRPYAEYATGIEKQATLPAGAVSLGLAGTAPGVLLEHDGRIAVALPGPPGELRRLWRIALETEPFRRLRARVRPPHARVLRVYGVTESAVARALDATGGESEGLDITICAHDFEVRVDLLAAPGAEERAAAVEASLADALATHVFARDGRPVEEIVLALARARGLRLAVAESCTGGLVAARMTSVAGSSDVFVGGVVAYSDELKRAPLGVPGDVLERHGAVSAEAAQAMAAAARERLGADGAVAVTGIAGPGGGTPEKPVGLVYIHAQLSDADESVALRIPGDRETVRGRATAAALHVLRRVLAPNSVERV